jgi:hypothetical protein
MHARHTQGRADISAFTSKSLVNSGWSEVVNTASTNVMKKFLAGVHGNECTGNGFQCGANPGHNCVQLIGKKAAENLRPADCLLSLRGALATTASAEARSAKAEATPFFFGALDCLARARNDVERSARQSRATAARPLHVIARSSCDESNPVLFRCPGLLRKSSQ